MAGRPAVVLVAVFIAAVWQGTGIAMVLFLEGLQSVRADLIDAARVDGCPPWRYLFRVLMPLCKPILASLFILDLVGTWNEFSVALTLLQDNQLWTVPLGLIAFQGAYSDQYTLLSAAVVMAMLPVAIETSRVLPVIAIAPDLAVSSRVRR